MEDEDTIYNGELDMHKLVLWGHGTDDYRDMFSLSETEINSPILEYGCGPSAVNSMQHALNHTVISCDPFFVLDKDTFYSKAIMIFASMAEEIKENKDQFNFSRSGSLEQLLVERQKGMSRFFADYEQGKKEGRYIGVTDYHLPFTDFSFEFALVSHYLFADLEDQTVEFHVAVIRELARVAKEVRIVPLIDREGKTSDFLGPVLLELQKNNYGVEVRTVDYHLYQSGNAMLRVWAQQCEL